MHKIFGRVYCLTGNFIVFKSTTSGSSMDPDKHPSDQKVEQEATKQDTESKSGKEKNQLP